LIGVHKTNDYTFFTNKFVTSASEITTSAQAG